MDQSDAEILEHALAHFFRHLSRVAHLLQLLGGFHQGVDHKSLMALTQFIDDELVDRLAFVLAIDLGLYRHPAGRHFVQERHLHVTVQNHGEAAWNRRCAHEQHMGLPSRRR